MPVRLPSLPLTSTSLRAKPADWLLRLGFASQVSTAINSLFKRNAVYVSSIFLGAFVFGMSYDLATTAWWDAHNRGVGPPSLLLLLCQRDGRWVKDVELTGDCLHRNNGRTSGAGLRRTNREWLPEPLLRHYDVLSHGLHR